MHNKELAVVTSIFLLLTDCVTSLKCWQCISETCNGYPGDDYRATEKTCLSGQFCQKVYFRMLSITNQQTYISTVRSCAWDCVPKDDFNNCTEDLYSSRGCIQKTCCRDKDLCNSSQNINRAHVPAWIFITLTVFILGNYFSFDIT